MRQAVEITIVAKCDVDAVNGKAVIESNCTDALAAMLPLQPVNDCLEILAFEIQGTREEAEIFGNDESKSSSYPFPLFVAWGESPNGESVARIDFASERERTAYKEGISDSCGWLAGTVSTESDNLLQYLESDCDATPENMEQARASFASPAPFGEPLPVFSVEVSAVYRYEMEQIATCNEPEEQWRARGFSVYIRNPMAFCVQDFWLPEWQLNTPDALEPARRAAFRYADVLAEHLSCSVVSQLQRVGETPRPFPHNRPYTPAKAGQPEGEANA